jgi:hypothetical protein
MVGSVIETSTVPDVPSGPHVERVGRRLAAIAVLFAVVSVGLSILTFVWFGLLWDLTEPVFATIGIVWVLVAGASLLCATFALNGSPRRRALFIGVMIAFGIASAVWVYFTVA